MDEMQEALLIVVDTYEKEGGNWVSRVFSDTGSDALTQTVGREKLLECFDKIGGPSARRAARTQLVSARKRRIGLDVTHHGNVLHSEVLIELRGKLHRSVSRERRNSVAVDRDPIPRAATRHNPANREENG